MNTRKNPALIELLLVVVFFSIASVILVQIFSKAFLLSKQSAVLSNGQMFLQGQMDLWQVEPDQMKIEAGMHPVNENMEPDENGKYVLIVEKEEGRLLRSLRLVLADGEDILIDLDTSVLKEPGV